MKDHPCASRSRSPAVPGPGQQQQLPSSAVLVPSLIPAGSAGTGPPEQSPPGTGDRPHGAGRVWPCPAPGAGLLHGPAAPSVPRGTLPGGGWGNTAQPPRWGHKGIGKAEVGSSLVRLHQDEG